jgi:hypothetical protein
MVTFRAAWRSLIVSPFAWGGWAIGTLLTILGSREYSPWYLLYSGLGMLAALTIAAGGAALLSRWLDH